MAPPAWADPTKAGPPGARYGPRDISTRERALKSRSLLLDVYGDYVRYYGGEIGVQSIAALAEDFGVAEETTRVTLSRLKREGWLDSRRVGRWSRYGLTDRAWRLVDEGRARIFTRRAGDWDGRWHLVIYQVPESERPVRERLRNALGWLGYGSLAPSTWLSPHDRTAELQATLADRGITARIDRFTASTGSLETDREMAARCWDLDAIQAAYAEFVAVYRPRLAVYAEGGMSDRECFVERVELVHRYRKYPFIDPDLPRDLLPSPWIGTEAHQLFLEAYELLREPAFTHFEAAHEAAPDQDLDTGADTPADTPADTAADTGADTAADTATDTGAATREDRRRRPAR